jgi:hypothetical protein
MSGSFRGANRPGNCLAATRPALADDSDPEILPPLPAADPDSAPLDGAAPFIDLRFGHARTIPLVVLFPLMNATTADVRKWARDSGLEVPRNGQLPADVWQAFEMAHGGADDGGPLVAEPADLVPPQDQEDPPGRPDATSPPDGGAGPAYTSDPEPRRPKSSGSTRARPPKVTADVRKDIRGKTALFLTIPAAYFERRDPVCGEVALAQVPAVADDLADIFCDSPDVVAFFTSTGGGFMKWLKLATDLQPVLEIMYFHHIAKSIGVQGGGPDEAWDGDTVPADASRYHAPAI